MLRGEIVKSKLFKPLALVLLAAGEILYCMVHPSPWIVTVEAVVLVQIWLLCVFVLWINIIWRSGSTFRFAMMDFLIIAAAISLYENSGIRRWIDTALFAVGAIYFLNQLLRRVVDWTTGDAGLTNAK